MFEDEKKELRVVMKKKLAALSDEERREKSAALLARVLKSKAYKKAKCVLGYASFGTEVSTDALLDQILKDGKRLALPRLSPFDNTLVIHEVTDLATQLDVNKFNIREPRANLPIVKLKQIQLILVPGLAFDEYGNRLGRGLGCYDKLMIDAEPKTKLIGLAFDIQILGEFEIPSDSHDFPVDLILTESRRINPDTLLNEFYEENKDMIDSIVDQMDEELEDEE